MEVLHPYRRTSPRIAVVAEDHELFRIALATILKQECGFDLVLEAGSKQEALDLFGTYDSIAFATFDLDMPGINDAGDLRPIREHFPGVIMAVVTASDCRADILTALAAGVHGYVPKTFGNTSMRAALNAILSGTVFVPWSLTELPMPGGSETGPLPRPPERKLTTRQHDVLRLIRQGHTNKDIARVLGLTESTVKVHAHAIYKALGVHNRVGAVSGTNLDVLPMVRAKAVSGQGNSGH